MSSAPVCSLALHFAMDQMWAEKPWEAFDALEGQQGGPSAWVKRGIPYRADANALQTLDVWIPCNHRETRPASASIPSRDGPWVVFIHGGAWRDFRIDSTSFDPTVRHMLATPALHARLGGVASIDYTLSPYPDHPASPSPGGGQAPDPSRMAAHPAHVVDVMTAVDFLQRRAGFAGNFVLLGHSCGATLALQAAMGTSSWRAAFGSDAFRAPRVILGLNGLYDLPALVEHPGPKHESLVPVYDEIIRGAFGGSRSAWEAASPASGQRWGEDWSEGARAILAQSLEDSLVPYNQTERMLQSLRGSKGESLEVGEVSIGGDHNDVWRSGDRLAEIIADIVAGL